ncbi:MAG: TetR/AcrR family transcriptional regulator [Gammaproteobacteria bacterium]|nr:TetR/AcrR family transcriptional regulator [Gammaproteobacteria bacterium]MDH3434937.1 TetR/AcrR family transcriptional regulator [Gammaproteobacteria bacterium]
MSKPDTRTRILVTSLLLFNDHGEPNTTTNEIADEVDISPGNLHYHFRKKSDLVEALLAEFQADVRRVLEPPAEETTIDDFWIFLHLLLETLAAYRFLLRDMETLVAAYPKVSRALKSFSKGLTAVMQIHIKAMKRSGALNIDESDIPIVSRNLVVIAMFSERFDEVSGAASSADDSALRMARAVLAIVLPYASDDAASHWMALSDHYRQ